MSSDRCDPVNGSQANSPHQGPPEGSRALITYMYMHKSPSSDMQEDHLSKQD